MMDEIEQHLIFAYIVTYAILNPNYTEEEISDMIDDLIIRSREGRLWTS